MKKMLLLLLAVLFLSCSKKNQKAEQAVIIESATSDLVTTENNTETAVSENSSISDADEENEKSHGPILSEEALAFHEKYVAERRQLWEGSEEFYNYEIPEATINGWNNPDYDEQMKTELKRVTDEINEFLNTSYTFEARRRGLPETKYDDIPKFSWKENEAKLLNDYSEIISRTDEELVINLNNGEKKVYKNLFTPPVEWDYTVYTFYKVNLEKEYLAIVTTLYEDAHTSFINLNTGKERPLRDDYFIEGFDTEYVVGKCDMGKWGKQTTLFFYDIKNGESKVVKAISMDGYVTSVYVVNNVLIFYYDDIC